jgi:hypothetical protein
MQITDYGEISLSYKLARLFRLCAQLIYLIEQCFVVCKLTLTIVFDIGLMEKCMVKNNQ